LYAALVSVFWLSGDARAVEASGTAQPTARRLAI